MSTETGTAIGANSEVGTLRTVMVHRPDLAHERLTPTNCHELLFDDVIWVRRARQEHDAFVDLMRERGVEVLLFHDLLAETLDERGRARVGALPQAPAGGGDGDLLDELIAWMTEMPADELATKLTGGVILSELPEEIVTAVGQDDAADGLRPPAAPEPALHPRHERLDLRRRLDQPMFWPARQNETLNVEASIASTRASATPASRSGSAASTTTGGPRCSRAATSCPSATASSSSASASAATRGR